MKTERSILKVLAYFDLFDYPLSEEEIYFYLDHKADRVTFSQQLDRLTRNRCIYHFQDFYMLKNDESMVKRRQAGNRIAASLLPVAYRIASFLYKFPFVRGVGISGSLSKNFADEKADIDFFIITSSNRLWIARTLMHLYKKLQYLTGHQDWYCMNYYVDENAMQIEEKNIFTATELITLKSVSGNNVMEKFFRSNDWANSYFHSYSSRCNQGKISAQQGPLKKFIEYLFNGVLGEFLDNYLYRLTTKRWQRKETNKAQNANGKRMGLRTGKHFAKPNPVFFQERILSKFIDRLNEIEPKLYETPVIMNGHHPFLRREII